mgnify:CR=1 FL=1
MHRGFFLEQIAVIISGGGEEKPLKYILYGKNIPYYFQTNATLQAYLARNPNWRDTLVDTGDVPSNFGGIKQWTNVSHAFFEDQNGTNQEWFDGDPATPPGGLWSPPRSRVGS